jgi:hypothetical protein
MNVVIKFYEKRDLIFEIPSSKLKFENVCVSHLMAEAKKQKGWPSGGEISLLYNGRVLPGSMQLSLLGHENMTTLEVFALERNTSPLKSEPFRSDIKHREDSQQEGLEECWGNKVGNVNGMDDATTEGLALGLDVLTVQFLYYYTKSIDRVKAIFEKIRQSG